MLEQALGVIRVEVHQPEEGAPGTVRHNSLRLL